MKKTILCVLVCTLALASACDSGKGKAIVVGSADYTEQDVLGNMLFLLLSTHTKLKADYKHEMSTSILWAAMQSADVDLCVEYTGTIYGHILKETASRGPQEVYAVSVKGLSEQYHIDMLEPLGFNNTYTLSVRPDTAARYGLKTYSDLAKVSGSLILGATFEIYNRNDGIPALKQAYNMAFKEEKAVESTLRYTAIANDDIQVTNAFATDGLLREYNLTVLEDDKNFFPPYHAAVIIREDTAKKYPEVVPLLQKLAGILDDQAMRQLNYQVDVQKANPADVARDFLKARGLL